MESSYLNNIRANYVNYLKRFINITGPEPDGSDEEKKKKRVYSFKESLLRLQFTNIATNFKEYSTWWNEYKDFIIPNKEIQKFKDNLIYDSHDNPLDYFPCMLFINKTIEQLGGNENDSSNKVNVNVDYNNVSVIQFEQKPSVRGKSIKSKYQRSKKKKKKVRTKKNKKLRKKKNKLKKNTKKIINLKKRKEKRKRRRKKK